MPKLYKMNGSYYYPISIEKVRYLESVLDMDIDDVSFFDYFDRCNIVICKDFRCVD